MKFKDAPIRARFKYPESDTDRVWVKINSYLKSTFQDGRGLIVAWNGNVDGYQSMCCFSDEESGIDFDTIIELI